MALPWSRNRREAASLPVRGFVQGRLCTNRTERLMSTTGTTWPRHQTGDRTSVDVEWLRYPGERAALAVCIAANLAFVLLAWAILLAGSDWLAAHPFVEKHGDWIRAVGIAGVIALPLLPLSRHLAIHAARSSGVRVNEAQFPELHEEFVRACRKLGVDQVPELYIGRRVEDFAAAYSAIGGRSVVVLDADLVPASWKEGFDWLAFEVAGALGALRLGHTRWWIALLTGYAGRVPGLAAGMRIRRTYSRDRCAAFVVPDGIRGLIVEAVGKDAVASVSVPAFVAQAKDCVGVWDSLGALRLQTPPIPVRASALYRAGLFDMRRDMERWPSPST
jgi:hypothetical protein